jgi:hypothetical protein
MKYTETEWKYILDLIEKKNLEVVVIMKKIPKGNLFSWKFDGERK